MLSFFLYEIGCMSRCKLFRPKFGGARIASPPYGGLTIGKFYQKEFPMAEWGKKHKKALQMQGEKYIE